MISFPVIPTNVDVGTHSWSAAVYPTLTPPPASWTALVTFGQQPGEVTQSRAARWTRVTRSNGGGRNLHARISLWLHPRQMRKKVGEVLRVCASRTGMRRFIVSHGCFICMHRSCEWKSLLIVKCNTVLIYLYFEYVLSCTQVSILYSFVLLLFEENG